MRTPPGPAASGPPCTGVAAVERLVRVVLAGLAGLAGPAGAPAAPPGDAPAATGAAPAEVLGTEQQARLAAVLAPYRPEALTAADALAIQQGLRAAGLRPGAALHAAMARAGFNPKQIEALAPATAPAAAVPASAGSSRVVPRPQ